MKILFLGDLYLNSPNNGNIAENFAEVVKSADYICLNLEGPIIEGKSNPNSHKRGPVIAENREAIDKLFKRLGYNKLLVTLANNHIMDYGKSGLRNTIKFLTNKCNRYLGAGIDEMIYEPCYIEEKGIKIALFSVAEGGFGVAKENETEGYGWFLQPVVMKQIEGAKKNGYTVIVVSHAGLEDVSIPLPEIRRVYRSYIDGGADLVIAHHAHVIQGCEEYKLKKIYYCLGNWMFDSVKKEKYDENSYGVIVEIGKDDIKTEIIPLKYENSMCDINDDSRSIFEIATKKLENWDAYMKEIDNICFDYYKKYYKKYYEFVCGSASALGGVIVFMKKILKKSVIDEDMLYHNLTIESHYWATCRGVGLSRKKEGKL